MQRPPPPDLSRLSQSLRFIFLGYLSSSLASSSQEQASLSTTITSILHKQTGGNSLRQQDFLRADANAGMTARF